MDEDGQVPAPRRAEPFDPILLVHSDVRSDEDAAVDLDAEPVAAHADESGPEDTPRVGDISALLAEIYALRTTLTTDLTLAAAALDAGAEDLAAEVVDDDLEQLHAFERRAVAHLRLTDEAPARLHGRRLRTRRMLPAAPALAAAAALIGFVSGAATGASPAPSTAPAMTSAAAASWELHRLTRTGGSTAQIREVAEDLNDRLAALVAVAAADPAAAQQALLLLDDTTKVLRTADEPGALADVLAETRALAARLASVLPRIVSAQARATRLVVPRLPVEPPPRREPARSAATTSPSSSAAAEPTPTPTPTSTPTPAPEATPAPSSQSPASAEPTSSPSPEGRPILPRPGDLSAF